MVYDLELYCAAYEQREISHEEVYLENTKTLLVGHVLINTYLREHPDLSMQSKILMLNEVLYSKYENEVWENKYPIGKSKKGMDKKYASFLEMENGRHLFTIFTGNSYRCRQLPGKK